MGAGEGSSIGSGYWVHMGVDMVPMGTGRGGHIGVYLHVKIGASTYGVDACQNSLAKG